MPSVWDPWLSDLDARLTSDLARTRSLLTSPQDAEISVEGHPFLSFCSNDYLGFANHPEIKAAAAEALSRCGTGGGASHLVIGHHEEHHLLEEELAQFTGRDRALVFSSGYMANMGVISTLVGKGGLVLQDKLNHASIIDGGLLSGARFQRYLHNDIQSLDKYLEKYAPLERKLVVTDGVFSMDGDQAPLLDMSQICSHHNALLVVDDAHGFGVLGSKGGGLAEQEGLTQDSLPLLIGTFGKAFGTSGAFVAGPDALIEYLIQFARPYIYTTSMPPAIAAATRKSLSLLKSAHAERSHLKVLIQRFRDGVADIGFSLMESVTPIQPIVVGSSETAIALSGFLKEQGILVSAIRPPTVPDGTARLRVTLSANHSLAHLEQLLDSLKKAWQSGLRGAQQ